MTREQTDGRPHPIHDEIFGSDPDGFVNDTPPGAIGERVNIIGIAAQPDKEARIVARRLSEWQQNMQANLDWIRTQVEGGT